MHKKGTVSIGLGAILLISILGMVFYSSVKAENDSIAPYNTVLGDVTVENNTQAIPEGDAGTDIPGITKEEGKPDDPPIVEGDAGDDIPGTTQEHYVPNIVNSTGNTTAEPELDKEFSGNATTAARINSVTVKTDKPAYNIGDSVQISGHVNPYEQVLIFIYNPNGDPLTSEVIEANQYGNYEFGFGLKEGDWYEAPVIPGTWTVKATFGNETAEVSITVKDPNCPEIDKVFCPITDPKYKNPKPVNPVPDDVTVIGNPVYAENGTAVGFIPDSIKVTGIAANNCTVGLGVLFNMLYTQDRVHYDYVVKNVKAINCHYYVTLEELKKNPVERAHALPKSSTIVLYQNDWDPYVDKNSTAPPITVYPNGTIVSGPEPEHHYYIDLGIMRYKAAVLVHEAAHIEGYQTYLHTHFWGWLYVPDKVNGEHYACGVENEVLVHFGLHPLDLNHGYCSIMGGGGDYGDGGKPIPN